ncbi:MAG: formylglycine-generating enzyme family protein [Planctomycetota bacterium]|nr:formylglycine-generating enzyme family protein [Planctomycetota bacterium]
MKRPLAYFLMILLASTLLASMMAISAMQDSSPTTAEDKVPTPPESFTNSLGIEFVYIKPGEFEMGSPFHERGRDKDEKQHRVKISKGFYLATTEMTQAQWNRLMGENRSKKQGDQLPVTHISWVEATAFCVKLGQRDSLNYRLPTEAEWEYACRAGSTGPFPKDTSLGKAGWYDGNSEEMTHEVGTKLANAWGLYDMQGNVWEWCQDWFDDYPSDTVVDPLGPSEGIYRLLRGGSWYSRPEHCRAAFRSRNNPELMSSGFDGFGFRLVLDPS